QNEIHTHTASSNTTGAHAHTATQGTHTHGASQAAHSHTIESYHLSTGGQSLSPSLTPFTSSGTTGTPATNAWRPYPSTASIGSLRNASAQPAVTVNAASAGTVTVASNGNHAHTITVNNNG